MALIFLLFLDLLPCNWRTQSCMVLVLVNLLRFVLWPRIYFSICFVFWKEFIFCCCCVECPIGSCWLMVLLILLYPWWFSVSLCYGLLKSPTIILNLLFCSIYLSFGLHIFSSCLLRTDLRLLCFLSEFILLSLYNIPLCVYNFLCSDV
jgi:hypothetical protein